MNHNFIYILISLLLLFLILTSKKILKIFGKFALNGLLGLSLIYISNLALASSNIFIGINIFTGIFTGVFGIPGIICLYILQFIV